MGYTITGTAHGWGSISPEWDWNTFIWYDAARMRALVEQAAQSLAMMETILASRDVGHA